MGGSGGSVGEAERAAPGERRHDAATTNPSADIVTSPMRLDDFQRDTSSCAGPPIANSASGRLGFESAWLSNPPTAGELTSVRLARHQ